MPSFIMIESLDCVLQGRKIIKRIIYTLAEKTTTGHCIREVLLQMTILFASLVKCSEYLLG